VKVAIVFEPDPDLGPDPEDEAKQPRRLGEFLDSDKLDVFVAWREIGEQFEGGSRTHFVGSGVWENLSEEQYDQLKAWLEHDGLPE
jgi:hypothetical protein